MPRRKIVPGEKRSINMRVPSELYIMVRRLCVDYDLSITDLFVKYLNYLKKFHYTQREVLDEQSRKTFSLDD